MTDAIEAGTCGLGPRLQTGDMQVFQQPGSSAVVNKVG